MRLKATIISLLSVLIVGVVGISLYCSWPAIQGTINGKKYYTADDVQNSYDNGFKEGCKTETELVGQVKYYKDIVDEYYIEISTLNDEIAMITRNNNENNAQIATLTSIKADNERTIAMLQITIDNNNTTINSLQEQVRTLQNTHTTDSADGTEIVNNITSIKVVANTNYQAVFTKLYTVTFVSNGSTVSTQ